jgi:hypothetical protein
LAIKRKNLIEVMGLQQSPEGKTAEQLQRDIQNYRTRLDSQGINTTPPGKEESLLSKGFRVLNIPGAAARGLIRAAVDDEYGVGDISLWENQTETSDILKALNLEPENKFAAGAANFVGNVALDPLTWLTGGIAGGLKMGAPFAKGGVQLTQKGLGQVAKVVPYLDEGKAVMKTVPDAFEMLFKGKTVEDGGATFLKPGPLKPVADAIGKVFSTSYGKDPQLAQGFQALHTNILRKTGDVGAKIRDIVKNYNLSDDELKRLLRLAEEPEQRALMGLSTNLSPTTSVAGLDPEIQESIMKALPTLQGGDPRLVNAFNDLQSITRDVATVPEAQLGWLNKGNLRPDYVKHELVPGDTGKLRPKSLRNVQDVSLLPREEGTVAQLNEMRRQQGRNIFDENFATATFARNEKAIRATESFSFVKGVLENPSYGAKLTDYAENALRHVDPEQAVKQMDAFNKLKHGDTLGDFMIWEGGGKLKDLGKQVVTKDAYEVLTQVDKHYLNPTDEGVKALFKAFDWATGKWKPLVTLRNPAFHVNNLIGNLWNMYLGDMNPLEMPTRLRQSWDAIRNNGGAAKTALGTLELSQFKELALETGAMGHAGLWADSSLKSLRTELATAVGSNRVGALRRLGHAYDDFAKKVGSHVEDGSKLALFIDQMTKLTPAANLTGEAALKEMAQRAAMHTKKFLFDYGDLTVAEKTVFRRILPFYSWSRKNIPLQVEQFFKQPQKFLQLRHARESTQLGMEEDATRPAYLEEALQTPFRTSEGAPVYWNPRLPAQDISRIPFIGPGDTGREWWGMLNPLAKVPLELTFNKSLFTGRPIERYEGETTPVIGGARVPVKTAYAVNSTLGVAGKTGAALQAFAPDSKATDRLRLIRTFLPGLYTFDPEQQKVSNMYEEVNRLQDLLRKYEDESGKQVPTKRELQALGLIPKD